MSLRNISWKHEDGTCKVKELKCGDFFILPTTGILYRMIYSEVPVAGHSYPIVDVETGILKPNFNRDAVVLPVTVDIVEV